MKKYTTIRILSRIVVGIIRDIIVVSAIDRNVRLDLEFQFINDMVFFIKSRKKLKFLEPTYAPLDDLHKPHSYSAWVSKVT